MTIEPNVTENDRVRLVNALRESLEIAAHYRTVVADEDSIVLVRNLETVAALLGIEDDMSPPRPEKRSESSSERDSMS